jgi:demethylmenaquinone methyltransferase/2-methoxy-6-polyprenyl-1,4-benzoquinol methylase
MLVIMQDAGFVRKAFAGIASRYVLANHVLSLGIDLLWRRLTARLVAEKNPRHILDLATGSGDLAQTIRQACPNAHILGADFSVPMMREAQRRHFHQLVAADGMALPFQSASFDVLTVAFGLRNMASWPDALKEMRRVLAAQGHLFVLDFSLPTLPIIRPAYLFYLKNIMPRIAGWITGQRAAYEYLCSSVERFPSGRDMESLILSCGFTTVKTHRLSFGIASLYVASVD